MDPAAIADGMNLYRIPTSSSSLTRGSHFCRLDMSLLRSVPKKGIHNEEGCVNSVRHAETSNVAFHLKQLEHMVMYPLLFYYCTPNYCICNDYILVIFFYTLRYNTVNGNEIVRVANNWVFFNRIIPPLPLPHSHPYQLPCVELILFYY